MTAKLIEKINLTVDSYKLNHPEGNIGKNILTTVKEILITDFPKLLLKSDGVTIYDIFFEITRYKIGCCFFINDEDRLFGMLTDGDIRRILLKDIKKKKSF